MTLVGRIVVLLCMGAVLITATAMSNNLWAIVFARSTYANATYRTIGSNTHILICGALGCSRAGTYRSHHILTMPVFVTR